MDVGIWRTSYSYPVSLVREVPGRWNDGYQSLCLLVTTTVFPNEINLISEWFAMTGFSVLCRELLLCSTSSGNGVEIVRGGDALLLGSVRILEHRGGHWSSSMKSFSAKSSRTLNPLSCDCGRHSGCGWPFFFECSGVIFFGCSSLLLYADLYTARYNLHFIKFLLVQCFNYDFG